MYILQLIQVYVIYIHKIRLNQQIIYVLFLTFKHAKGKLKKKLKRC